MPLERVEPTREFGSVGLQPLVELSERLRAQAVEPPLSVAPDRYQASLSQHPQVPGNARLVHPHTLNEVANRPLTATDRIQDAAAGRLGDRLEDRRDWHGV